nr:uncharacterized protein LOC112211962 isoform X2 [Halyomorpha halys]
MWQYREDPEANRLVDAYILKHYYYLLEISGLYHRMDGRTRIFSISQLIIYFFTLTFHLILIIKSTIPIYGLNKVLFSQNVHFALLMVAFKRFLRLSRTCCHRGRYPSFQCENATSSINSRTDYSGFGCRNCPQCVTNRGLQGRHIRFQQNCFDARLPPSTTKNGDECFLHLLQFD